MKYKWLLFDADSTLFDYDKAEETALKKAFEGNGLKCSEAYHKRYNRINKDLFDYLEKGLMTSKELRIKRFKLLFSEFDINLEAVSFSTTYLDNLSQCSLLLPDALEVIRELAENHKLLIVTNGIGDVQRPRINNSDISDYIDGFVISEELGIAKPAKEYFDVAFEMMGKPDKNDVLIIGDSLSSDMTGGVNYGIDTCWFNPDKRPNDKIQGITYEIDNLKQVIKIATG